MVLKKGGVRAHPFLALHKKDFGFLQVQEEEFGFSAQDGWVRSSDRVGTDFGFGHCDWTRPGWNPCSINHS